MTIASRLTSTSALVLLLAAGAAADVTVDTTVDADVDDAACSLREAIVAANTDASYHGCVRSAATVDQIGFDLGTGTPSISISGSSLPNFTGPVVVDGATGGATRVEVTNDGSLSTGFSFLGAGDASGSAIRNLVVNGFSGRQLLLSNGSGIAVEGCFIGVDASGRALVPTSGIGIDACTGFSCGNAFNLRIGGTSAAQRNVVVGGTNEAISLLTSGTVIQGNYINTDATGTTRLSTGFSGGISLNNAHGTVIGGDAPGAGNVITGFNVITITGNPALARSDGTVIQGNHIGTDVTGTVDIGGGGDGVIVAHAVNTQIGGTTPGAGNVISGNAQGVTGGSSGVSGASVDDTTVQGNVIGADVSGLNALGNTSFGVNLGDDAVIEDNVIAFNGNDGITVNCGACIQRISRNALHANVGLGIDLNGGSNGPDPNDQGDSDAGPNGRQNFPLLDAVTFPGGLSIDGTLDSTASTTFRVEVFANDSCDPSGSGEGRTFVGANDAVTSDANGTATFTVTFGQAVAAGTRLTATAIAPDGSTSELSPCTAPPPTTTTTSTTVVSTSTTLASTTSTTLVSTTSTTVASTTSTTVTTSTLVSTTVPSSTTTTSTTATSSTTSSTAPPPTCELLDGKKLLLKSQPGKEKQRGINLLSQDADVTLGAGNGSADDPVVHGGSLRVVTTAGDGFDDVYPLPAERWSYVRKEGAGKGYKFRPTKPIKSVLIQPGKRVKVIAKGLGLGHTLGGDPRPVAVVLTLGGHCYCFAFGGDIAFKPDKKLLAKDAPAPAGCPTPASPSGAFVD